MMTGKRKPDASTSGSHGDDFGGGGCVCLRVNVPRSARGVKGVRRES